MPVRSLAISAVAGLAILAWLLIPAAITTLSTEDIEMQNDDDAGYSNYTLHTNDGKTYDIQYKISNGTVESMHSSLPRGLSLYVYINTTDNGNLELKLPRELADRFANVGRLYVSAPYKPYKPHYIEVETTCDYRVFSIDFGHATERIILQGSSIGYINQIAQLTSLKVDIDDYDSKGNEAKRYLVETTSYTKICSWEFIPEDKKLRIIIDGIMEVRPDDVPLPPGAGTGMGITIPKEVLGDPFVVMIDGERIDHVVDSDSDYHTTMHFRLNETSKVIEIIGTTAIPEFGSISMLVMAVGIVSTLVALSRFGRGGGWNSRKDKG